MTTDVKVQFFSHLNGLNLGNNWGDLIRLLDATLVNGVSLPIITAASINEQGDVHLTFNVEHKALLFQVVELISFTPESLNQKYRIKGVPNATSLILKPETSLSDTMISSRGTAKLASLGYEIIFRDVNDVKRVYRAKNPTAQHPFIRVDETLSNLEGSYTETYAKYAMVGLLENMMHIDDYANPDVLQLPFDPSDPAKNWKITGTGTDVVRGWSCWYYARSGAHTSNISRDSAAPSAGNRPFSLIGDADAFYFMRAMTSEANQNKVLSGCGLFNYTLKNTVIPNWFLMTFLRDRSAGDSITHSNSTGGSPLSGLAAAAAFYTTQHTENNPLQAHILANPIIPSSLASGFSNTYLNNPAALEVPFSDANNYLRGSLKHVYLNGNNQISVNNTTPILAENSMYVADNIYVSGSANMGSLLFYLGELE